LLGGSGGGGGDDDGGNDGMRVRSGNSTPFSLDMCRSLHERVLPPLLAHRLTSRHRLRGRLHFSLRARATPLVRRWRQRRRQRRHERAASAVVPLPTLVPQ